MGTLPRGLLVTQGDGGHGRAVGLGGGQSLSDSTEDLGQEGSGRPGRPEGSHSDAGRRSCSPPGRRRSGTCSRAAHRPRQEETQEGRLHARGLLLREKGKLRGSLERRFPHARLPTR